ncbi:serine/threonine protein kinase [Chamaesiphon polymorphus]|uniref:non-specific serine/threonine protein kinase n=1 Tax=Chamaesiphon polymorphus CCALA 037 TaxID=2107692 RepID=A0A2T1GMI1_9CYAN|nr:serine/threonine-protein kinase [Chamaesiphon polymorphus]PSB59096.1 serine/threonine protein kinase [Chamaesiphon polymorphus CCALA 037]
MFQIDKTLKDRYQIIDILGQGGIATTYAATDLETDETVAIKVMSLRRAQDWKAIELFEREAKILAQLNHPCIPKYLDYFQIDSDRDREFYIVQSLAPGTPLSVLIDRGWQPEVAEVEQIAAQILAILAYLHHLNPPVIHRDLKPQNLIKSLDGKISLVDFGAVQDTYHQTVTGGSTVVGTYGYMAPEQFRGQAFLSTDLYGLGTTLLFLLTRSDPSNLPQKQLKINFRSTLKLPPKFADWLDRMLEPTVEQRFTTAAEALAVLQGMQKLPPPVANNRPRKPKDSPIRLIADETTLTINIPAVKFRTTGSQQLCSIAAISNFILAIAIYLILTASFSIEPLRLSVFIIVSCGYTATALWMLAYTIYGNFSRVQLEIAGSKLQLKHWCLGNLVYNSTTNIKNIQLQTDRQKLSILPFDRSRVRIGFADRDNIFAPLVKRLVKSLDGFRFLLPLIKLLEHYRVIGKMEINLVDCEYALALLLTPAENQWLASELSIFLDRALRRQQIYRAALDLAPVDTKLPSDDRVVQ